MAQAINEDAFGYTGRQLVARYKCESSRQEGCCPNDHFQY